MLLTCFCRSSKCCFSLKCVLTNHSYSSYLLFFVPINPLMLPVFTWRTLLAEICLHHDPKDKNIDEKPRKCSEDHIRIRVAVSEWAPGFPPRLRSLLWDHPMCLQSANVCLHPGVSTPNKTCEWWTSVATAQQSETGVLPSGLQLPYLWTEELGQKCLRDACKCWWPRIRTSSFQAIH